MQVPLFGEETSTVETGVNGTLRKIIKLLKAEPTIAKVDEYLVDDATKGLVQWQWAHFREDMNMDYLPKAIRVNEQLVSPMQKVINMPDSGLHFLFHEGLVDGKMEDTIRRFDDTHRALIYKNYKLLHPRHFDVQPYDKVIETKMNSMFDMQIPRKQELFDGNQPYTLSISPLTRYGVGYALARCNPSLLFLAAEDVKLDAKAEETERNFPEDSSDYQLHVMQNRNTEFIRRILENPDAISHLLVGYNHKLQQAIAESHAKKPDKKLSHIVVSVNAI